MVRRVPSRHRNTPVARERDSGALARLVLLFGCGLVLATGFVYAGGKHFAALRLGYQTEKLRTQLQTARDEQKRLLVQREVVSSPARLEWAARQLGLQPMQAAQLDPLRQRLPAPEPKSMPAPNRNSPITATLKQVKQKPSVAEIRVASRLATSTSEPTGRR